MRCPWAASASRGSAIARAGPVVATAGVRSHARRPVCGVPGSGMSVPRIRNIAAASNATPTMRPADEPPRQQAWQARERADVPRESPAPDLLLQGFDEAIDIGIPCFIAQRQGMTARERADRGRQVFGGRHGRAFHENRHDEQVGTRQSRFDFEADVIAGIARVCGGRPDRSRAATRSRSSPRRLRSREGGRRWRLRNPGRVRAHRRHERRGHRRAGARAIRAGGRRILRTRRADS